MIVIPTGFSQVTLDFQIPAPGGTKVASTTFGVREIARSDVLIGCADAYNDEVWQLIGSVRCRMLGGNIRDAISTYEYVMDEPGTVATALPPPNVSLLVKKVTTGAGRKNRGRLYPPGVVYENTYDDQGQMAPTDQASYLEVFTAFLDRLTDVDTPMVILHNDETEPTTVEGLAPNAIAATQRRRLR